MTVPESGARYRLGPRSTRGLIAGWRPGQIACVAAGLLLAVAVLRGVGGVGGGLLALVSAAGGAGVAIWPIGGRTLEQWVPTVAAFGLRATAEFGHRPWRPPDHGRRPLASLSVVTMPEPGDWEPAWRARLESLAAVLPGRRPPDEPAVPSDTSVGVVGDRETHTWTAVLPVGGTGFTLLSEAERVERVTAWSGVLAAMARDGTAPHRLQWLSCAYPAWLGGGLPTCGSGRAGKHYAGLLHEAARHLWSHEIYLALTVRNRGDRRGFSTTRLLWDQLARCSERLRGAGLSPGAPLSAAEVSGLIRRSYELTPVGSPRPWPWPVSAEERWKSFRTDAAWHATFWIAEWPRSDVAAGFLLPMLLEPSLRRIVSVTMAPVAGAVAVRRAERDRTEGTADAEVRHRHGFAVTARAAREQESRQQREAELAEGHAAYRYSGYVTVTAEDLESLEGACTRLQQSAALAQLDLRRLYGAQEEGYCCTLPTGRGCR